MKDAKIYKVRRKADGLFATKHKWRGLTWSTSGSIWKGVGPLKLSFREGKMRDVFLNEVEIVVFELKEVAVTQLADL